MLTNEDLKQIRKIVREEIEVEKDDFNDRFSLDLKMIKIEISNGFHRLADKIKDLTIKIKGT